MQQKVAPRHPWLAQGLAMLRLPFLRYVAVVGVGFTLDFLVFSLALYGMGLPIIAANILGGAVGVTFAYFMAARHIFEYRGRMLWPKLVAYLSYQVMAVLLFSYLIAQIVVMTGITGAYVKMGLVPVQFVTNYIVLRNLLLWFEHKSQ